MNILCIGQEWRGSDSSGLFHALSRIGQTTNIVDEQKFIPTHNSSLPLRIAHRLLRPFLVRDFNKWLTLETENTKPDLILIYKGPYILPGTMQYWNKRAIPIINFYPDISFTSHTKYIPKCIPLYTHIYSTKSFAKKDLQEKFHFDKVTFIPHGFDPIVHRKLNVKTRSRRFDHDVTFIGHYSVKKMGILASLISNLPELNLKIWGLRWPSKKKALIHHNIAGYPVFGDQYAIAVNRTKINLGLLTDRQRGASNGDLSTARTFQIPGCGGFLLHERTEEVQNYFNEGQEMECFSSEEELADKTKFYLQHEAERERIAHRGHLRAQNEHSLDHRAKELINHLRHHVL